MVSSSVIDRATFTVPADTSEERVQAVAYKYIRRAGNAYEGQGFQVVAVSTPQKDTRTFDIEPDRSRYVMHFRLKRRPVLHHLWVPDDRENEYKKMGWEIARTTYY